MPENIDNAARKCGTLLHISSLPGQGPIGTMGAGARAFADFLRRSGQQLWQLLPLTPPARGDSPYSSYSVFAGNPWFIDMADLEAEGLLPAGSAGTLPQSPDRVDYAVCAQELFPLLRKSYPIGSKRDAAAIARFREQHADWLEDYALFMAVAEDIGPQWQLWPDALRVRETAALQRAYAELRDEVDFHIYVQYLFFMQWQRLREYANSRHIQVVGDMPIYVDLNSADTWANPEIFQLGPDGMPPLVAGVPPDSFSATGQLWGNPLYDWERLREDGYGWWVRRLRMAQLMYDTVRIDHFRALDAYYAIPAGDEDARGGVWCKGPGLDFLDAVRAALPGIDLIAEDLGLLTDSVRELLRLSGLPGLKVLQFAFDPVKRSTYLPHSLPTHCVAYIGTHDNDTALGWLDAAPDEEVAFAREYIGLRAGDGEHWGFIRTLLSSVADTAIVQMQDFLGLGSEARMNIPAQPENNWTWRMPPGAADDALADRIHRLCWLYGRLEEELPAEPPGSGAGQRAR